MKQNPTKFVLVALTLLALFCGSSHAQSPAPKLLPFQGRLTDQNGVAVSNGVRLVQFKIFEVPTSGSPVWAGELHRTTVNGGLVNVLLGSKTPFTGVDFDRQLHLEITVDIHGDNAITAADPPMLPRQVILPVVFAKESADSRKLAGGEWRDILVSGNDPKTGFVSGAKLQPLSITSAQIANGAVTSDKIADQALEPHHLALTDWEFPQNVVAQRLRFPGDTAQKIDLQYPLYGIGLQSDTVYFRTGDSFAWFYHGEHANGRFDPGAGGRSLMILDGQGNLTAFGTVNVGNSTFGGQSLELKTGGPPPFIDFANDQGSDFDARIILENDDNLRISGADLVVDRDVRADNFINTSDRARKTDFARVNSVELLQKVAALPIQTWRFTNNPPSVRHIGPTAQDFHDAFNLGADEKGIASVDADGVALAAIQGLNQMLKEKDAEISALKKAMEELQKTVSLLLRESKRSKD